MKASLNNRKDILLLLLYCKGSQRTDCEPIRGSTRMMKLVFLFYKELAKDLRINEKIPEGRRHEFKPYHFGPFSREVFDDIQFLENTKFIVERGGGDFSVAEQAEARLFYDEALVAYTELENLESDSPAPLFYLTEKGRNFAKEIYDALSDSERRKLEKFKERYNHLSLIKLLRYVYTNYEAYASKSMIKESI